MYSWHLPDPGPSGHMIIITCHFRLERNINGI